MIESRPVDPTKYSNRKCEHCEFWGGWDNPICKLSKKQKEYYNRCKNFIWRKDGNYTVPPENYACSMPAKGKKPVIIARKLAAQMWGRPDGQLKLAEGIWMFSTPSHGGIIVDTDVRPEILKVRALTFVYIRAGSSSGYTDEQHFVALEEDCDASIAEWLYANEIITPRYQKQFTSEEPFEIWKANRIDMLYKSLNQWNSDVLKVFPVPGTGQPVKTK